MKRTIVALLIYSYSSFAFGGAPTQRLPQREDFNRADVVCAGVAKIVSGNAGPAQVAYTIDNLIKGDAPNVITVHFTQGRGFVHKPPHYINVTTSDKGEDTATLPPEKRCLLFLKRRSGSEYTLLDPGISIIDLATSDARSGDGAAGPFEKLMAEVAAATASDDSGNALVALETLRSLGAIDAKHIPMLRGLSDQVGKSVSGGLVQPTAVSSYAVAARLTAGDDAALDDAIAALDSGSLSLGESSEIIRAIRLIKDPRLVHRLGALLWSGNPKLEVAAAYALANLKSREAFPYLQAGLKSSNIDVQYRCMVALSDLPPRAEKPQLPGVEIFRTDPGGYLRPWIEWCQKQQAIYGPALPSTSWREQKSRELRQGPLSQ